MEESHNKIINFESERLKSVRALYFLGLQNIFQLSFIIRADDVGKFTRKQVVF